MKSILTVLVLMLMVAPMKSQTISPVIQQCSAKGKHNGVCQGEFSLRNNMIGPLYVTLESYSFSIGPHAEPLMRKLDSDVKVVLTESSVRLSPMAEHKIGYRLTCPDGKSCGIQIVSSMVVGKTANNMQVRLSLPELVYFCSDGKPEGCRNQFRLAAGLPPQ